MKRTGWIGLLAALMLVGLTAASISLDDDAGLQAEKVGVCHATPANGGTPNKYEYVEADNNGVDQPQGHTGHSNDVWPVASAAECPTVTTTTSSTTTSSTSTTSSSTTTTSSATSTTSSTTSTSTTTTTSPPPPITVPTEGSAGPNK